MSAKLIFAGKPLRQHRQHQRIDTGTLFTSLLKKVVERDGPGRQCRCRRQQQADEKLFHDSPACNNRLNSLSDGCGGITARPLI